MPPQPSKPSSLPFWRKLWRTSASLFGLGLALAPAPPAQAQSPAPAAIPQHWLSYAQLVSKQFEARLSDPGNDAVVLLHQRMQARMLEGGSGNPVTPAVVVRVWIAASGQVQRVDFDSLGDPQADQALRAILTARPLSEPPPPDMRQPMVLRLKLEFLA